MAKKVRSPQRESAARSSRGRRAAEVESLHASPRAWPALLSLATVGAISLGLIAFDVSIERRTAERTSALVDDSIQSIALADDLRYQAHRLSTAEDDHTNILDIVAAIAADAREYGPLATEPGEKTEWARLQGLLAGLQASAGARSNQQIVDDIEGSIHRLVAINQAAAAADAEEIRRSQTYAVTADIVAGAITLLMVGIVGVVLVRSLARQRELVRWQIAMLADENRELEAFAARVAHDLRGPLSPVAGYADLLAAGHIAAPEASKRIHKSVDRMSAIIDDLLALSVAGRPTHGEAPVAQVIDDVLGELSPDLAGAKVEVHVADVRAACSPGVLAQLLRNIVSNAIKYRSPLRPLALDIAAQRRDGAIELAVRDNGVGMSPEAVAHAFEPFFRAARDRAPGHGLGLAIVERTVSALGGECELESHVDEGTRVALRLPAVGPRQPAHA